MINQLLGIVAPHHCYCCGKIGTILCGNCKYDIVDDPFEGCIVCEQPARSGICRSCTTTYSQAWCVGERAGSLRSVIDGLKFERVKDGAAVLASLLDERLPVLPSQTVIVPVPTIAPHIRQRGYDHTRLIAKTLGSHRKLAVRQILRRTDTHMQRGQNRAQRMKQAERAFVCNVVLDGSVPYLLVDDVVTTNATLQYAAACLQAAGAQTIWVAVLARQPLDK
jgi:ComF family protein